MPRSPLFVNKQAGGMFAIEDMSRSTGSRFYVDSGSATGADAAGYGKNPDAPFLTLDYAIGQAAANNGDIIYLCPGHAETRSVTGAQVTVDVDGISIIGLGNGVDRPTFTFSHTGATWTWSAASVTLKNVVFICGVDSVTTAATISGTDAVVEDVECRDTTDVEFITDLTVTGDRFTCRGFFKNGYVGGNANVRVLSLAGVDNALIENCRFRTKVTTAVVGFVTTLCTNVNVRNCVFLVDSTTNLSKDVVDTVGSSTWSVDNCFDLGAGLAFSGGSGAALASDDVGALATANSTAHSSGLSATVSLGVANATAHSSGLSSTVSLGTANSTAHSSGLSATVSLGVVQASTLSSIMSYLVVIDGQVT